MHSPLDNRLMAEYDFIFETPYAITKGSEYPCTIDRPKGQERGVCFTTDFSCIGFVCVTYDIGLCPIQETRLTSCSRCSLNL